MKKNLKKIIFFGDYRKKKKKLKKFKKKNSKDIWNIVLPWLILEKTIEKLLFFDKIYWDLRSTYMLNCILKW